MDDLGDVRKFTKPAAPFTTKELASFINDALYAGDEDDDSFQELSSLDGPAYHLDAFINDEGGPRYIVITDNRSDNDNVSFVAEDEEQLTNILRMLNSGSSLHEVYDAFSEYSMGAVFNGEEY